MIRGVLVLTFLLLLTPVLADTHVVDSLPIEGFIATFTTEPDPLPPSDGTLTITLTRNGVPVAGERVTLSLEGRKRVLVETDVVTDAEGKVRLRTYFSSAGEYTLILRAGEDEVSFPVIVRGTVVLVSGLVIALGILVALLFEKRLS